MKNFFTLLLFVLGLLLTVLSYRHIAEIHSHFGYTFGGVMQAWLTLIALVVLTGCSLCAYLQAMHRPAN